MGGCHDMGPNSMALAQHLGHRHGKAYSHKAADLTIVFSVVHLVGVGFSSTQFHPLVPLEQPELEKFKLVTDKWPDFSPTNGSMPPPHRCPCCPARGASAPRVWLDLALFVDCLHESSSFFFYPRFICRINRAFLASVLGGMHMAVKPSIGGLSVGVLSHAHPALAMQGPPEDVGAQQPWPLAHQPPIRITWDLHSRDPTDTRVKDLQSSPRDPVPLARYCVDPKTLSWHFVA